MNAISGMCIFGLVYFFLVFRSNLVIAFLIMFAVGFGSVLAFVSERFSSDTNSFLTGGLSGICLMFVLWALLFREKKKNV
jgi:hypothetical protein